MSTDLKTLIHAFATPEYGVEKLASAVVEGAILAIEKANYGEALKLLSEIAGANGCLGGAFAFAEVAMHVGKHTDAVKCLIYWQGRYPERFDVAFALGIAAFHARILARAEESLKAALKHDPKNPDVLIPLSQIMYEMNRLEESLTLIDDVLQSKPDDREVLLLKSACLSALGRPAQASDIVEGLLASEQFDPSAFSQMVDLDAKRATPFSPAAQEFVEDGSNVAQKRAVTAYALGRLKEKEEGFDQAFRLFNRANDICRTFADQGVVETAQTWPKLADEICKKYPISHVESCARHGSESEIPVFILSMPRTGSTLVEQILASHPDVGALGESFELRQIEGHLDAIARKNGLEASVCLRDRKVVKLLADNYLDRVRSGHPDAKKITDKMPRNMKRVGLIATLFPRAKIIYCVRDPRDMALSIYKNEFAPDWGYATSLEGIAYETLKFNAVMSYAEDLFGDHLLRVAYEDLVFDIESVSKRIVAHVGLPWSEACLDFHKLDRGVITLSQNQVRQPLYTSSVGSWRKYETQLQPLIQILNNAGAI